MPIATLLLLIALVLYTIVAIHPRRFSISSDFTALGLALICFTILVVSHIL